MQVQRLENELIIKLSTDIKAEDLQNILDVISYREAVAKSKAKQSDVDELAKEVKKGWWKKNKERLVK